MLIVLPPSEGKTRPQTGPPLDLASLSSPRLTRTREQLLNALVRLSSTKRAAEILGLGPQQADDIVRNARLREEPTAPAIEVYTGVLYGELGWADLDETARERGRASVAVASALFGLVRPHDLIPAYRMSGSVSLPRLGTVASRWKPVLPAALVDLADGDLVLDLRSGTYVALGQAPAGSVTMRVLTEANGKRSIVSHSNKATKGRIVRQLLAEGVEAKDAGSLADALRDLGWSVESSGPARLDVVLR
ncbi:peroxide stress protein YaaA [Aeromicrobium senzhongii]|uniref:Peroxide stress protein YaaA n=1 Tax=Aeromicrobium senzhongii TaxID=2663859 RepID=A0ABX6T1M9_9ACTN|nr:peroxide stress protein YaaA [Aeromicrobium senzhongii]MTB87589.1 peroxide stress protein YaaA [Aeromicrobium senzhongii]QNL95370.1 peroxide stress protein YaaA [Aeromicrobium senzhongii]